MDASFVHYLNRHPRTAGWHAAQMRAGVKIQTKKAADDFITQADREVDLLVEPRCPGSDLAVRTAATMPH
jgi:hypothetical protein